MLVIMLYGIKEPSRQIMTIDEGLRGNRIFSASSSLNDITLGEGENVPYVIIQGTIPSQREEESVAKLLGKLVKEGILYVFFSNSGREYSIQVFPDEERKITSIIF
jgi:hypothetical protein